MHDFIFQCNAKDQFTCDSGHCISISGRCNGLLECTDKSDEGSCSIVFIDPTSYRKYYPPIPDDISEMLDIKVNMNLFSIEKIMEIDMTFETKFTVTVEWKDYRLTYYNLKEEKEANIISMEDGNEMWIPPLVFNNTNDNTKVQNNEDANIVIRRLGMHTVAPILELNENYVYSGAENNIVLNMGYVVKQGCNFKLEKYPFDSQVCTIEVIFNIYAIYLEFNSLILSINTCNSIII